MNSHQAVVREETLTMSQRDYAIEKFMSHRARIGVLGLGYAGLPLACTFAENGFETLGFDIDMHKIEALRNGQSYNRARRREPHRGIGPRSPAESYVRL